MRRTILALLTALMLCATGISPALADSQYPLDADDEIIQEALEYLQSEQSEDGCIVDYPTSAWAIMAISAAGEDPHTWSAGGASIVDYVADNAAELGNQSFNPPNGYARTILAIVAAGENPYAFGEGDPGCAPDGNYVDALLSYYDEEEGQFVYEATDWGTGDTYVETTTLNDDVWGLMALVAAGMPEESDVVCSLKAFIEDNQGEDGGFSWATLDNPWYWESDTDTTAAALMALNAAGGPSCEDVYDWAIDFLHFNQTDSGGFFAAASWGTDPNLASTNWAVAGLSSLGLDPSSGDWTPSSSSPVDYILSCRVDGHFEDPAAYAPNPAKDTSDAIVALLGEWYPVAPEVHVFEDYRGRGVVTLVPEWGSFRMVSTDGYDSGFVNADRMTVRRGRISVRHFGGGIRFVCRAYPKRDFCFAHLYVRSTRSHYFVYDRWGFE